MYSFVAKRLNQMDYTEDSVMQKELLCHWSSWFEMLHASIFPERVISKRILSG